MFFQLQIGIIAGFFGGIAVGVGFGIDMFVSIAIGTGAGALAAGVLWFLQKKLYKP